MGARSVAGSACVVLLCAVWASTAAACPYCRADATGLAASTPPPSSEDAFPLKFSGGFDVPSAFYFRGYLQTDTGPIFQPYLNVFSAHVVAEDIVVRPYVSMFHSAHWGDNNRMSDMFDVMLGAVASGDWFSVDARYAYYNMSPQMRSRVHELGAKASVDLLSRWREDADWLAPFGLRPFVGLYGELSDQTGTNDVFLNLGLEPSWRFEVAGQKVGLSLPTDWGMSADHYYLNADGTNAALGYFATALTASASLPMPERCGKWFLNASVQYLHLSADSVRAASSGDSDLCIGKIGLSFVY
jgi:hypothetical protein